MTLKSAGMTVLSIAALFIFGALMMNFVIMPLVIHRHNSVIVPDVRGMSELQAKNSLAKLSLEVRVERSQNDTEVPDGYVIAQRPRPNDSVKQGRTVAVTLSLGPKTQRVPDLRDMSLRQGRLLLNRQGLQVGRTARVLSEGAERETVIACSPGAGERVEEGAEVDVLVKVGGRPKQYLMPNLVGQDLLFVREKLEKAGFQVRNVRYEPKKDVFPNTIIAQVPERGTMIREGDSIELVAAGTE